MSLRTAPWQWDNTYQLLKCREEIVNEYIHLSKHWNLLSVVRRHALQLIDRFLQVTSDVQRRYTLLPLVCFWLAVKCEDSRHKCDLSLDVVRASFDEEDCDFSTLRRLETELLSKLEWRATLVEVEDVLDSVQIYFDLDQTELQFVASYAQTHHREKDINLALALAKAVFYIRPHQVDTICQCFGYCEERLLFTF